MNERIKQLMAEAGYDIEALKMYPGGFPREDLLVLESFAQLIVNDVLNIVAIGGEFCSRPKLFEQIKEHFGVK
jgi:hypothetical protein